MALVFRGILATLMTTLVSAFLGAAVITGIGVSDLIGTDAPGSLAALFFFVLVFAVVGASVVATLLALAVELPKSIVLVRRQGGTAVHIFSSLLGGLALGFVVTLAVGHPRDLALGPNSPLLTNAAFFCGLGAMSGLCSAGLWWAIVIAPLRRERLTKRPA